MRFPTVIALLVAGVLSGVEEARADRGEHVIAEQMLRRAASGVGEPRSTNVTAGGCTLYVNQSLSGFFQTPFVQFDCPNMTWGVVVRNSNRGLQVGPAYLVRGPIGAPGSTVVKVFDTANLAEVYTVYKNADRISDMHGATTGVPYTRTITPADLGPSSFSFATPERPEHTVAAEIRDRGLAWTCKWMALGVEHSSSRRGQAMVLWGVWDPGNYDYVIEYTFRDDGQISFRIGATGWNNVGIGTNVSHTHDALWRVGMSLGYSSFGTNLNTPYVHSRTERSLTSQETRTLFNDGLEGAMDLEPIHFSTLVIESEDKNAAQNHLGYELQPFRTGTARHWDANERWTLHDTFVTRASPAEDALGTGAAPAAGPDVYLLGNAVNQYGLWNREPVVKQRLALWHVSSVYHDPHDEDQAAGDPTFGYKGVTLMHWTGFDLVPHNLFDANPLGGPHRHVACDGPV